MVIELPRVRIGEKEYYIDERLTQLRNVENPSDFIDFRNIWEMRDYVEEHKVKFEFGKPLGLETIPEAYRESEAKEYQWIIDQLSLIQPEKLVSDRLKYLMRIQSIILKEKGTESEKAGIPESGFGIYPLWVKEPAERIYNLALKKSKERFGESERTEGLKEIPRGHEFKLWDRVVRISDRREFIISVIRPVVEAGRSVTLYLLECLRTKATITVGFEGLMRDFNIPITGEEVKPKMANKDQAKEEILSAVRRWWSEELGDTAYSLDDNLLRELKNLKIKHGA